MKNVSFRSKSRSSAGSEKQLVMDKLCLRHSHQLFNTLKASVQERKTNKMKKKSFLGVWGQQALELSITLEMHPSLHI